MEIIIQENVYKNGVLRMCSELVFESFQGVFQEIFYGFIAGVFLRSDLGVIRALRHARIGAVDHLFKGGASCEYRCPGRLCRKSRRSQLV